MTPEEKTMNRITKIARTLSCAAALAASAAVAQYPTKQIQVFMPGAPGGSFDTMTRLVMTRLAENVKQPVVVENITGAGGMLALDRCLQANPDGHNVCIGYVGNLAIAPWIYPNMTYDPVKDVKPVVLLGSVSFVLAVPASSPFRSVGDLVRFARAHPGKLNYASSGNGTGAHVGGELMKQQQKLDMVHVPYQGNAPASVALLGGHVDWSFEALPTALPNVKAGKLRALAVSTPQRSPDLPDVPTMAESGFAGFDLQSWLGVVVPAKTPDAAVRALNAEINKILDTPELKQAYQTRGAAAIGGTPEQFATFVKAEIAQYGKVMAKAKAD
jgi:tripartite-type tricarboxylate transporter receptor subunit TctC